jgi:hypothetical protein
LIFSEFVVFSGDPPFVALGGAALSQNGLGVGCDGAFEDEANGGNRGWEADEVFARVGENDNVPTSGDRVSRVKN